MALDDDLKKYFEFVKTTGSFLDGDFREGSATFYVGLKRPSLEEIEHCFDEYMKSIGGTQTNNHVVGNRGSVIVYSFNDRLVYVGIKLGRQEETLPILLSNNALKLTWGVIPYFGSR